MVTQQIHPEEVAAHNKLLVEKYGQEIVDCAKVAHTASNTYCKTICDEPHDNWDSGFRGYQSKENMCQIVYSFAEASSPYDSCREIHDDWINEVKASVDTKNPLLSTAKIKNLKYWSEATPLTRTKWEIVRGIVYAMRPNPKGGYFSK